MSVSSAAPLPAPATMTQAGRRFLRALAGQATSGSYLELGPLFGSSTQAIADGRAIEATIHTIDTFEPAPWVEKRLGRPLSREAFDRYTGHIDDLVVHQGFAPDVVRDTWSDSIGFYFDDATHGDPGWTNNFEFFSRYFTDDAIVCGDDFAGGWPDIPRNVNRIAAEWGVGLYIFGRVWAMTRGDESRLVQAATEAEPVLAGATVESAHGPTIATNPAMVWSKGLHQRIPLSSFRYDGDVLSTTGFVVTTGSLRNEYDAGDWVHLAGASSLSMVGPTNVGFQLCLAHGNKTENTKLFRPGEKCRIAPESVIVAVRLGMV